MASYLTRLFNAPFFQNKFVLYGSLFIVLLSILRYLANRNINAVVLMALIGLVMSYFSKNMIIVLLTAFASVFLLEMLGSSGVTEGMETKKNSKEKKDDDDAKEEDAEQEKKDKKADVDNKAKKNESKSKDSKKVKTQKQETKKQGMTKLSPASYDGKDGDDDAGSSKDSTANRIDYASTLEQAYDNIENIIGEEGVRGLTDQTKSLMNQQKQLMENMKDMGPLLKSAEGFMKQITGGGGIGGITEMLKGFATPGGSKANSEDKK